MLELSKPVEEGKVKNWEDVEIIWDYCFKKVIFFYNYKFLLKKKKKKIM
jgi:actin-related protein